MSSARDTRISKALSKLLRHQAVKDGLAINSQGEIPLSQILNHNYLKSNHATIEDIQRIVNENEKKRFLLSYHDDSQEWYIAATQGHSIREVDDTIGLVRVGVNEWPELLIHGTYRNTIPLIVQSGGISKMSRNHIHLTYKIPARFANVIEGSDHMDVISGVRGNCEILIFLDVQKLKLSGIPLYKSANGVYLTPGDENGFIPLHYFDKVVDYQKGVI